LESFERFGVSKVSFGLIDTCTWIDFLRYQEGELGNQVAALISLKKINRAIEKSV
jgi:hypothetical protein